jgi:hypothetical protein
MDLGEVGWGDVDWIGLVKDRNRWRALVNSVLNLRVPWNAGKLSNSLTSSGLSSSAQLHIVSQLVSEWKSEAGVADYHFRDFSCIVRRSSQATTSEEDIANWEYLAIAVLIYRGFRLVCLLLSKSLVNSLNRINMVLAFWWATISKSVKCKVKGWITG